jgi:hypothetical protein
MKILILPFIILFLSKLDVDFIWLDNGRIIEISDMEYGQKPPGKTPVLFSPEFIVTKHRIHSSPAFSPDMNEVYWSVLPRNSDIQHKNETILFSQKVKNKWSSPKIASFSGEYNDGGPLFSFDGNKLYFYSKRPLDKKSKTETRGEIWFVERHGEDWGIPRHIKIDFEGEKLFFSISENNNIYFTSGHGFGGAGIGSVDIYCTKFINGSYAKPERLSDDIVSRQFVESDPLISPDEKYLIFYSLERPENIGQYDLYITYHIDKDRWTKPINLGTKINKGYSRFPRFSPDSKYIFFVRPDGVYWVDSSVISEVKNKPK